jgi:hypothetical protein
MLHNVANADPIPFVRIGPPLSHDISMILDCL